jgi:putative endonuclease
VAATPSEGRRGGDRVDRRRALGVAGEDLAAAWYVERGYEVLARNWRCRDGELDLVLARGRTVVFCEVKARSSLAFGSPLEAVTAAKRRRIRLLASRWLEGAGVRPASLRFDVDAVLGGELEVVEAAF